MTNFTGRTRPDLISITYHTEEKIIIGLDTNGLLWKYKKDEKVWANY